MREMAYSSLGVNITQGLALVGKTFVEHIARDMTIFLGRMMAIMSDAEVKRLIQHTLTKMEYEQTLLKEKLDGNNPND